MYHVTRPKFLEWSVPDWPGSKSKSCVEGPALDFGADGQAEFKGAAEASKAIAEMSVDLCAGRISNTPLGTALASLIAMTRWSRAFVLLERLHQLKPALRHGFARDVFGLRTKPFSYHPHGPRSRTAHVVFFWAIGVE